MQATALSAAAALLVAEVATDGLYTRTLMLSAWDPGLRFASIVLPAVMLAVLVGVLYFVVARAARRDDRAFDGFVARNFAYLRNLSLLSDLAVKFAGLALVIHVGHPRWTGPLLLLYTADYLVQGRLFTLPVRAGLVVGAACLLGAVAQALTPDASLAWPLVAFVVVSAASLGHLIRWHRRVATT